MWRQSKGLLPIKKDLVGMPHKFRSSSTPRWAHAHICWTRSIYPLSQTLRTTLLLWMKKIHHLCKHMRRERRQGQRKLQRSQQLKKHLRYSWRASKISLDIWLPPLWWLRRAWPLIRLQHIYNLWSIHAIILSIYDVLYAFICHFIWFLGLTY